MLLPQILVKMLHVQIEILLLAQRQHLLDHRQRHALGNGLAPPAIQQSVTAMLPIAPMQAPHLPVAHDQDLGCLPPRTLFRHRSQYDTLDFHHPVHGGARIAVRSSRMIFFPNRLSKADISCANPTGHIMCY